MSLDENDGVRVVTPVVFFPPGSTESAPLNQVIKVDEEAKEPEENPDPKDSSVPESASSSSEPVVPEQPPMEPSSPSSPVPPAPPAPVVKDSGQPKESESSTPAGS